MTSPHEELLEELSSARQEYDDAESHRLNALEEDGEIPLSRLTEFDIHCQQARIHVLELECRLGLGREEALTSAEQTLASTMGRLRELRELELANDAPPPYESTPQATANQAPVRGAMPGQYPGLPLLPPEAWLEQRQQDTQPAPEHAEVAGQEREEADAEPQLPGGWPGDDDDRLRRRALHTHRLQLERNGGDNQHEQDLGR
jgi:hypothetical protein